MTNALADKLQIWGIENDFIIYSDGSLGFVLDLKPLDISFSSDDLINAFSQRARQFLNGLPEEIDIQFIKEITKTGPDLISAHKGDRKKVGNALAEALCDERVDQFNVLNDNGMLPIQSLTVVVRRKLSGPLVSRPKIFSKQKLFESMSESRLRTEIAAIDRLRKDLSHELNGLGLKVTDVHEDEIVRRIYDLWNPTRTTPVPAYNSDDLRWSLLFTDISIEKRGFTLSDLHYRCLSLKLMPDQTIAGMSQVLNSLPFGSQMYLSIHVPNQQKEMESLQTQRRLAFSLANGRPNATRDIESEAKLEDLETILEEMVQGGEKVFRVGINIVLKSNDLDELNSLVSDTLMKLRQLGGAEAMEETVASFDIFSEFCFPHARSVERQRRIKTSNLVDFLPLYGPWMGHDVPATIFRSRMGSLFRFDPFSQELTNANQLVSGGSGAGKSFLTNKLLLQMLKDSPKIFIIDIGGSYKKLVESLGGQYIPLGVGGDLSINPFDLREGDIKPNELKIKFLVGLLELMTKEEDQGRLPRLERAELERAIQVAYDNVRAPMLSDLRKVLLQHEELSVRAMGKVLGPWCGETPFGQFVDRPTNIKLNSPIICWDLKGLETHPDLQAACLFIITDVVWREVQADKSTKKFLVLDECWKLLENSAGAALVGEVFRTFRKYHASAIAISQTIDDFAKSAVANAVLPNSSVKWLMRQKGADKESLKEILSLNDNEVAIIDTLHQEKGKYSEAFLMASDGRSVVLVESTPLEYWIATTDPRDLSAIEEYSKQNPSKTSFDAFKALAELYPSGISAGQK